MGNFYHSPWKMYIEHFVHREHWITCSSCFSMGKMVCSERPLAPCLPLHLQKLGNGNRESVLLSSLLLKMLWFPWHKSRDSDSRVSHERRLGESKGESRWILLWSKNLATGCKQCVIRGREREWYWVKFALGLLHLWGWNQFSSDYFYPYFFLLILSITAVMTDNPSPLQFLSRPWEFGSPVN